jgi:predicted MFS family arabinose efflux permease|tara:strand:- start:1955 stop:2155 length:201 start_codon:yes stop_codon:yes gene_type:complete
MSRLGLIVLTAGAFNVLVAITALIGGIALGADGASILGLVGTLLMYVGLMVWWLSHDPYIKRRKHD